MRCGPGHERLDSLQSLALAQNAADSLLLDITFHRCGNRGETDKTIGEELHSHNSVIPGTPLSAQKSVWANADLGISEMTLTCQEKGQVLQ